MSLSQMSCPVCGNAIAVEPRHVVYGELLECQGCETQIEIRAAGETRSTIDSFVSALGTLEGRPKRD